MRGSGRSRSMATPKATLHKSGNIIDDLLAQPLVKQGAPPGNMPRDLIHDLVCPIYLVLVGSLRG